MEEVFSFCDGRSQLNGIICCVPTEKKQTKMCWQFQTARQQKIFLFLKTKNVLADQAAKTLFGENGHDLPQIWY